MSEKKFGCLFCSKRFDTEKGSSIHITRVHAKYNKKENNAPVSIIGEIEKLADLPLEELIEKLNSIREALHKISPFKGEPVDFVKWVKAEEVFANDYNPNSVAPPEMKLLETSIKEDGYTQPIVSWIAENEKHEVVDGFHRHRVGKESEVISKRVHGYLPVTIINDERQDRSDRIAATIRHNRARGKHKVEAMSDIVIELSRRNWSDSKISEHLGMEQDEILRLKQITGLAEMFSDQEFSKSWEVDEMPNDEIAPVLEDKDEQDISHLG